MRLSSREWIELLAWYFALGGAHELSHLGAAALAIRMDNEQPIVDWSTSLIQTLLFRQTVIASTAADNEQFACFSSTLVVRHVGWIFSVLVAVCCCCVKSKPTTRLAATLTALEALSTDLMGIYSISTTAGVFFCGNFGIILLHEAWSKADSGKTALDILEMMISITMMRGAQSGGVISFNAKGRGIRSRVVNRKRTDLSKMLRRQVDKDISFRLAPMPFFIAGHTRFATSSISTLEGTHPQRWCPPIMCRVYDMNAPKDSKHPVFKPRQVRLENYITHNGDFDFVSLNGVTYNLEMIQDYLTKVLGPMPASVDSCAIAGMIDILRCRGSFGLSARYAVCLGLPSSRLKLREKENFPTHNHFEGIGRVFEEALADVLQSSSFEHVEESTEKRHLLAAEAETRLRGQLFELIQPLQGWIIDDPESGSSLYNFCVKTIDAFFDNDLFWATKHFLQFAKGSFGLCVTSSLDSKRQICFAARGQTMSIAFYPKEGLVCYGSEQAAVKAGLNFDFPGKETMASRYAGTKLEDNDVLRLDLDDLGGEICLLDWATEQYESAPVSRPNRELKRHKLMHGKIVVILHQESKISTTDPQILHRLTRLTRNNLIKRLKLESEDPVLSDIMDIAKVCNNIQNEWRADKASSSLNRLSAFNLSRCLRERLEDHVAGRVHPRAIDILLTGCEVSLWLAEQFGSDLQKAFPNLCIRTVSANKILGLYGQDTAVPALGFPDAAKTHHLHKTIVIIVSHSGGTFGPLACSNLLQSVTAGKNIFVVTSEWDTQIGRQLRKMDEHEQGAEATIYHSRTFSTECGTRPAEPCSLSVAAMQQLLTNLFLYLSVVILSDPRYKRVTEAAITEEDVRVLEKCNMTNIEALTEITGTDIMGKRINCGTEEELREAGSSWAEDGGTQTETELRKAGSLWAEHVLENTKAYILTLFYIFGTVVSGYPLAFGISVAAGLDFSSHWMFLVRLFDAAIYFWMPQIWITVLRFVQGRNLRHRMVARTVAIADIPWVAQSAEAFLSKLFANSFSIAGVNVISGNPSDHFIHRHTHRVVRGTLLVCGRPDGRLSALSTAEASSCLSVNQASSIQSWGGTCESITIGHNPFKLPLTQRAIFLKRKRPLFLCERLLIEKDVLEENVDKIEDSTSSIRSNETSLMEKNVETQSIFKRLRASGFSHSSSFRTSWKSRRQSKPFFESSVHDPSIHPTNHQCRSAAALIGAYQNVEDESNHGSSGREEETLIEVVIKQAVKERKWSGRAHELFHAFDLNENGFVDEDELIQGSKQYGLNTLLSDEQLRDLFKIADSDGSGELDFDEFLSLLRNRNLQGGLRLPPSNRDERGIVKIFASQEKYFGEIQRKINAGKSRNDVDFMLARSQQFSQELYETRIASLQRFVALTVLFHQMGKQTQNFFDKFSFGLFSYPMHRTHSIMRIATTASPISGADVLQRMHHMQLLKKVRHSVHVIETAYLRYKKSKAIDLDGNDMKPSDKADIVSDAVKESTVKLAVATTDQQSWMGCVAQALLLDK